MSTVSDAMLKIAIGRLVSADRIRLQLEAEFGCSLADKVDLIRECLPLPPPPSSLPPAPHAFAYGTQGSGNSMYQHQYPAPPVRSSTVAAVAAASALLSASAPPTHHADYASASAGLRLVSSLAAPHLNHHPRQYLEAPFLLPVVPLPISSAATGAIGQSPDRPYVCNLIPETVSHDRMPPHFQHYQQPATQLTTTQEELHARRGYTIERDRSAFICDICQHGCVSGNDLNRHRAEVHLNKHRFACDQCAYRCARNSALRDHKLARHSNQSAARDEFSRSEF